MILSLLLLVMLVVVVSIREIESDLEKKKLIVPLLLLVMLVVVVVSIRAIESDFLLFFFVYDVQNLVNLSFS